MAAPKWSAVGSADANSLGSVSYYNFGDYLCSSYNWGNFWLCGYYSGAALKRKRPGRLLNAPPVVKERIQVSLLFMP